MVQILPTADRHMMPDGSEGSVRLLTSSAATHHRKLKAA